MKWVESFIIGAVIFLIFAPLLLFFVGWMIDVRRK